MMSDVDSNDLAAEEEMQQMEAQHWHHGPDGDSSNGASSSASSRAPTQRVQVTPLVQAKRKKSNGKQQAKPQSTRRRLCLDSSDDESSSGEDEEEPSSEEEQASANYPETGAANFAAFCGQIEGELKKIDPESFDDIEVALMTSAERDIGFRAFKRTLADLRATRPPHRLPGDDHALWLHACCHFIAGICNPDDGTAWETLESMETYYVQGKLPRYAKPQKAQNKQGVAARRRLEDSDDDEDDDDRAFNLDGLQVPDTPEDEIAAALPEEGTITIQSVLVDMKIAGLADVTRSAEWLAAHGYKSKHKKLAEIDYTRAENYPCYKYDDTPLLRRGLTQAIHAALVAAAAKALAGGASRLVAAGTIKTTTPPPVPTTTGGGVVVPEINMPQGRVYGNGAGTIAPAPIVVAPTVSSNATGGGSTAVLKVGMVLREVTAAQALSPEDFKECSMQIGSRLKDRDPNAATRATNSFGSRVYTEDDRELMVSIARTVVRELRY